MNDYYAENSYGMISFQADVSPAPTSSWYLMPNTMTYYGIDSSSRNTELVHDALQAAYDSGVNLANYKLAIVVHAGNDEAMPPHSANDIHSYTIPGYVFSPQILIRIPISTSVVSEKDPMGVYAHESGHLLGLPDLYDTTALIDPANNFVGYWELMGLGEWNPNNGNPLVGPGTYPSHMSAWSKISLGFIPAAQVVTFQSGETGNVTIENLESTTTGTLATKIPIAYNTDGSLTYYLVEMRAKQGVYDQYLPFPSSYPDAGLLIYKVNESIPSGSGSIRVIDAHPGGSLNDAAFGPCVAPCASNNTFSDPANFVKVIITATTPTAYTVNVDRTGSPPFLLEINTPSNGVLISIDGINMMSDSSGQLRLTVRYGPHTVYVEARIPVSLGSTSVPVGLSNVFAGWDDGVISNPRGVSVVADTILTAIYRITIEPSLTLAVVAVGFLTIAVVAAAIHRQHSKKLEGSVLEGHSDGDLTYGEPPDRIGSLPGNDGLSGDPVSEHQKPESTDA